MFPDKCAMGQIWKEHRSYLKKIICNMTCVWKTKKASSRSQHDILLIWNKSLLQDTVWTYFYA